MRSGADEKPNTEMESRNRSNPRKNSSSKSNRVAPPESLGRLLQQLKEEKEKLKEGKSEATLERVNSLREEIRRRTVFKFFLFLFFKLLMAHL